MAAEVAVESGRGHTHLPSDRAQRGPFRSLRHQQPARGLDDLLRRSGPETIAPARRLDHHRLLLLGRLDATYATRGPASPRSALLSCSGLTVVNSVCQVYNVNALRR